MSRHLFVVAIIATCQFSHAPLAIGGKVELSIEVDRTAKTWEVFAEVTDTTIEFEVDEAGPNDEILGIAFFDIDVVGEDGVQVTGSQNVSPLGTLGNQLISGFRLFRSDGTGGLRITGSQDTFTSAVANPDVVIEGIGLQGGADPFGAVWGVPALLARGSYSGDTGKLTVFDHQTGQGPGFTLLYGDPAVGVTQSGTVEFAGLVTGAEADVFCLDGDVDCDGEVGLTDFNTVKANFGASGTRADGDLTDDGVVDLADFNLLKANFGQSAAAVPEPSTLSVGLIGLIAAAGAVWRRNRRGQDASLVSRFRR